MRITHLLKQTAVYWAAPTKDGYQTPTFSTPSEISVRWENKSVLFVDENGKEVRSKATIYIDQDVDLDGYLFLGEVDDLSSDAQSDPRKENDAYPIRGVDNLCSFDGTTYVRRALL